MRPNTIESGIFSTKRNRPVSTSMLTRMLVPKPKKALQSPGVQIFGSYVAVVEVAMTCPLWVKQAFSKSPARELECRRLQHRERGGRVRDPAEDRALRLDHREAYLVEFREVGGAAVGKHDAAI